MNTKQRKEWLASLKTGDIVAIESSGFLYKITLNYKGEPEVLGRTLSVTGILPKGRSDGIGGKIVPATAEHIAAHTARCARVKFAYGFNWNEVTDEQVLAIAKILNFDPLSGGK